MRNSEKILEDYLSDLVEATTDADINYEDSILKPKLVARCYFDNIVEYHGKFLIVPHKLGRVDISEINSATFLSFASIKEAAHELHARYLSKYYARAMIRAVCRQGKHQEVNELIGIGTKTVMLFSLFGKRIYYRDGGYELIHKKKSGVWSRIRKLSYRRALLNLLWISGNRADKGDSKIHKNTQNRRECDPKKISQFLNLYSKEISNIPTDRFEFTEFNTSQLLSIATKCGLVDAALQLAKFKADELTKLQKERLLEFFCIALKWRDRYRDFYYQDRLINPLHQGELLNRVELFIILDNQTILLACRHWIDDFPSHRKKFFDDKSVDRNIVFRNAEENKNPKIGKPPIATTEHARSPTKERNEILTYASLSDVPKECCIQIIENKKRYTHPVTFVKKTRAIKDLVEVSAPKAAIYQFNSARKIDKMSTIVLQGNQLLIETCQENPATYAYRWNFPKFLEINKANIVKLSGKIREIENERVIFPVIGGAENYYTFLIEILPRIYVSLQHEDLKNTPLLFSEPLRKWQVEILDLMQINHEQSLVWDGEYEYHIRNLVLPVTSVNEIPSLKTLQEIREHLIKKVRTSQSPPKLPKKIYISRERIQHHRKLINEEQIKTELQQRGFEIIIPEKLSVAEQIDIFHNAELIVGPTGAWCANSIFCKKGARLVVFGPSDHQGKFFPHISSIAGVDFFSVIGQSWPSPLTDRPHWNYSVDIDSIIVSTF